MLPLAPLLWTAAGWLTSNAIGLNDMLSNMVDPRMVTTPKASIPNTYISYLNHGYDFQLRISAPSNEDIEAIDNFFESYGYHVNKFDIPVLNVRSTFTFVKTRDAVVYSSVKQASEQYSAMLNAGTKFWVGEIGE